MSAGKTQEPTKTRELVIEFTQTSTQAVPTGIMTKPLTTPTFTKVVPTSTATSPPPTPTPSLGIGSTGTGEDGMTLLYVPAGEFPMGVKEGQTNAKPLHTVFLDAFWIDETEVTNEMYSLCVRDAECTKPFSSQSYTRESYYGNSEYDDFPVIYVTWNDAQNYCAWAGRRLPTEAEWEKVAGWDEINQEKIVSPWGDSGDCTYANYYGCVGDTAQVGSFPNGVSPYGVFDMGGNIWEWVNDWYSSTYYGDSPDSNPTGPESGTNRVVRGGSWRYSSWNTSTARAYNDPSTRNSFYGFRCAMDAE